ncbi:hypothetical protein [Phaeovulum sp. NW3]|uniref:hypothetical protein n=1 Tax=Phaeovulum sp. NW3 TaxID=2934933 RepID=UPI002021465F|nr:hypothetical protein [Phaeovulum sp. NW3]MCL7464767.1 hypothetical protein [Phaeovulum sp. NW3]
MTRLFFAALLALVPMTASANARCSETHAAMSCPQGQVWDSASKACVLQSS